MLLTIGFIIPFLTLDESFAETFLHDSDHQDKNNTYWIRYSSPKLEIQTSALSNNSEIFQKLTNMIEKPVISSLGLDSKTSFEDIEWFQFNITSYSNILNLISITKTKDQDFPITNYKNSDFLRSGVPIILDSNFTIGDKIDKFKNTNKNNNELLVNNIFQKEIAGKEMTTEVIEVISNESINQNSSRFNLNVNNKYFYDANTRLLLEILAEGKLTIDHSKNSDSPININFITSITATDWFPNFIQHKKAEYDKINNPQPIANKNQTSLMLQNNTSNDNASKVMIRDFVNVTALPIEDRIEPYEPLNSSDKILPETENYLTYFNKGKKLSEEGNYTEALKMYDKSIFMNNTFAKSYTSKGNLLYTIGKYEESIASIDKAISLDPFNSELYSLKSKILEILEYNDKRTTTNKTLDDLSNEFSNSVFGLSLMYPKNWTLSTGNEIQRDLGESDSFDVLAYISAPINNGSFIEVSVLTEDNSSLKENPSLHQYLSHRINSYKNAISDFHLQQNNLTNATISGRQAYQFVGTYLDEPADEEITISETGTIIDSQNTTIAYVVIVHTNIKDFDIHSYDIESIINSIKINDNYDDASEAIMAQDVPITNKTNSEQKNVTSIEEPELYANQTENVKGIIEENITEKENNSTKKLGYSLAIIKMLMNDTERSLHDEDKESASIYLDIIREQIQSSLLDNNTKKTISFLVNEAIAFTNKTDYNRSFVYIGVINDTLGNTTTRYNNHITEDTTNQCNTISIIRDYDILHHDYKGNVSYIPFEVPRNFEYDRSVSTIRVLMYDTMTALHDRDKESASILLNIIKDQIQSSCLNNNTKKTISVLVENIMESLNKNDYDKPLIYDQIITNKISEDSETYYSSIPDAYNNNQTLLEQNNSSKITISNETLIPEKKMISKEYIFEKELGEVNNKIGSISMPLSLAIDSQNNVYVSDFVNKRIQKFDSDGNYLTSWGTSGSKKGQFKYADGLAVDNNDNVFVSDSKKDRIQKFDSEGNYLTSWGKPGTKKGQFNAPEGIAIDSQNNVYVCDSGNNRIQKFDSEGNYLTSWGKSGTKEGQFKHAEGITVDSQDSIYVSDSGFNRIQKFDSDGNYLASLGKSGTKKGQFQSPQDLAVNKKGVVFVVDQYNKRVLMFKPIQNLQ